MKKNIIKNLNLEDLPKEKQEKIMMKLQEIIAIKLTGKVIKKLSDEDKEKYSKLLDQDDPKEMKEFLTEKIDNYEKLAAETSREVLEEFKKRKAERSKSK